MVSAIHCVSYIAQYTNIPDRNYTIHVSIGYYIYDLLYLLHSLYAKKTTQAKLYTIYVFHHFILLYMLITIPNEHREPVLHSFFLAELSNITLYLSYHLHKEYPQHDNIIRATEFIQLLWYSYFRVYRASLLFYNDVHDLLFQYSLVYKCSGYLIYLMGIICSVSLVKKNIANCRAINKYRKLRNFPRKCIHRTIGRACTAINFTDLQQFRMVVYGVIMPVSLPLFRSLCMDYTSIIFTIYSSN